MEPPKRHASRGARGPRAQNISRVKCLSDRHETSRLPYAAGHMAALDGKDVQFERAGAGTAICLTARSVLLTVMFGERSYGASGIVTALKIHPRVARKKRFPEVGRKIKKFETEEYFKGDGVT